MALKRNNAKYTPASDPREKIATSTKKLEEVRLPLAEFAKTRSRTAVLNRSSASTPLESRQMRAVPIQNASTINPLKLSTTDASTKAQFSSTSADLEKIHLSSGEEDQTSGKKKNQVDNTGSNQQREVSRSTMGHISGQSLEMPSNSVGDKSFPAQGCYLSQDRMEQLPKQEINSMSVNSTKLWERFNKMSFINNNIFNGDQGDYSNKFAHNKSMNNIEPRVSKKTAVANKSMDNETSFSRTGDFSRSQFILDQDIIARNFARLIKCHL
jgi:hypothetical protein